MFCLFNSWLTLSAADQQLNAILTHGFGSDRAKSNTIIRNGDIFSARIHLWPVSARLETKLSSLAGNKLGDGFFVVDVGLISRASNNPELVTVEVVVILQDVHLIKTIALPGVAGNISLKLRDIKFGPRALTAKKIYFHQSGWRASSWRWYYLFGLALILLVVSLVVWVIRLRKESRERLLLTAESEQSPAIHIKATWSRQEVEEIFQNQTIWRDQFPEKSSQLDLIMERIDQIQYCPEWSDHDIEQINQDLQEIGSDL
ncbi:MAG: hypothetical protein HN353_03305 [Bdellovibrionales bacterium]|nr:hypothetical protein [Bdellovibrionales bacterium]MBT3526089.1 hypothetical protein [Bdellovibrionales bacterium]MBT7670186.1 hypothetical protein [Bdellovibrionales bacterium]MBT7765586.1 hypothetical protein [Bdellovibrionales bacterium]